MQETDDQLIDRLSAAGATDDEIVALLRERKGAKSNPLAPRVASAPAEAPKKSGLQSLLGGIKTGAVEGTEDIGNAVKKLWDFTPAGMAANVSSGNVSGQKKVFDTTDRVPSASKSESVGRFVGSLAPGLVLSTATAGVVNPIMGNVGTKLLGPTANVLTSGMKSVALKEAVTAGITTIPQELFSSVIAESLMNPEAFQDTKSTMRAVALSSIGSIMNMGFAYRGALKAAKTPAEVAAVQAQIKEVTAPAPVEVSVADRALPTQVQVASGRAQMDMAPGSGQLPTHREAAIKRMNEKLEEEAQKRLAELENITPKKEVDRIAKAAAKREVDPLIQAQVLGVEARMKEVIRATGGGKGIQTAPGVDLGVVQSPNMFLTLDELNDHLRILNMASTQARPEFKPGQRMVLGSKNLMDADEIAARATGGPIRAVDKTIQQSMKDVQTRLDVAAAQNLKMLDPGEEADIVSEMLEMSRRLSRGFEVPRKANLPLGGADESTARRAFGEDLSTSGVLNEPNVREHLLDDTHKRWVTGSDEVILDPAKPDVPTIRPPESPTVGAPLAEEYADAVRGANIDYTPKNQNIFQRIGERLKKPRQEFVDRTAGIGQYNQDSADMLSLLSGTAKAADDFYKEQMTILVRDPADPKKLIPTVVQGRALGQVIDGMKPDQVVELDAYLKASTLLSSRAKDPKFVMDIPVERAKAIVDNAPDHVKKWGSEFKVVADALIDDSVGAGRYSATRAAELKAAFYAGLSRSFNNPTMQNTFARRYGSKKASLSPLMLMRDHIFQTMEVNRKNIALGRLIDDYDANPLKYAGILEPVRVDMDEVPGFKAMVKDFQENAGMSLKDAEDLAMLNQPSLDLSNGRMVVYREGRPTFWKVNEDIDRTMKSFNPVEFGILGAVGNALSVPTRSGVSIGLDLAGIGPISDTFLTAAKVPGFIPIVHSIQGAWHNILKTSEYFERNAVGGGSAGRFQNSEAVIFKTDKSTVVGKIGNAAATPLTMLQEFIRPVSDAARMGEYLVRRRKLGQDAFTAALGSRRTLGDYGQHGASLRGWSLVTEFGNVGITTADAAYRLGRDAYRAAKAGNLAPMMKLNAIGVGAITMPTVYFWAAAQGDDELNAKRLSDTGYRFWWTRLPNGDIVKYPKVGWWMGQAYGSSVEAMLDGFSADDRKRLADGFISQVGINTLPIKVQQMFGLLSNTRNPLSLGPNIPITPQNQMNLDPSVQGSERTSGIARGLADNAGLNPFKTDYVIDAFGGPLFSSVIRALTPNDVSLQKTDIPVFGRFFTKPGASSEGSSMFYRDLREAQKADNSRDKALKSGDIDKVRKIEEEYAGVIGKKELIESIGTRISEYNKSIQTILMDQTISAEDKREYINNIRKDQEVWFDAYAKAGVVEKKK